MHRNPIDIKFHQIVPIRIPSHVTPRNLFEPCVTAVEMWRAPFRGLPIEKCPHCFDAVLNEVSNVSWKAV